MEAIAAATVIVFDCSTGIPLVTLVSTGASLTATIASMLCSSCLSAGLDIGNESISIGVFVSFVSFVVVDDDDDGDDDDDDGGGGNDDDNDCSWTVDVSSIFCFFCGGVVGVGCVGVGVGVVTDLLVVSLDLEVAAGVDFALRLRWAFRLGIGFLPDGPNTASGKFALECSKISIAIKKIQL